MPLEGEGKRRSTVLERHAVRSRHAEATLDDVEHLAVRPCSIIVAVDGGVASGRALARAVEIAELCGSRLTVIYVLAPACTAVSAGYLPALPPSSEEFGHDLLETAAAAVGDRVPVHTVLRKGRVVDEILGRIEAADHDLVMIGRPRRRLARLVFDGSVSRALAARSRARVVVVR